MAYSFIDLDKSTKEVLVKHLKDACGIEMSESKTKDELVNAILDFENMNGFERQVDQLPESQRPKLAPTDIDDDGQSETDRYLPIAQHPRVKVKIHSDVTDDKKTQEYFQVNEYKCLVVFGKEIEIPKPVYDVIKNAKQTLYEQLKDGSLQEKTRQTYNVEVVLD